MSAMKDPFEVTFVEVEPARPAPSRGLGEPTALRPSALPGAATARLHGFDLDDQPLIVGLRELRGEIVPARSAVPLLRSHVGSEVVVVFEQDDVRRPIVLGVIQKQAIDSGPRPGGVSVHADEDHVVLSAERQITLKCGDASITLTRAGKVIIRGKYVVSRSSGYNKIKGAAVDIN